METKKTRGRPKGTTKPEDSHMIAVKLTIKPDQREKLQLLGRSRWLRAQIDKAQIKLPTSYKD